MSALPSDIFDDIVGEIPEVVYSVDLQNHRTTFSNRKEFLGYSLEELSSPTSITHAIHPDDLPRFRAAFQAFLSGKSGEVCEYRLKSKSGEWEWIRDQKFIAGSDSMGRVTHFLSVVTVLTETRRTEQALRTNEEILRALFVQAPVGMCLLDAGGHVILWNSVQEGITGIPQEAAQGKILRELQEALHTRRIDEGDPLRSANSNSQPASRIDEAILQYTRPDGTTSIVRSMAFPVQVDASFLQVVTNLDITKERTAYEAFRRQAVRARALAELAGDINRRFDLDHILSAVCSRTCEVLDLPAASILLVDEETDELYIAASYGPLNSLIMLAFPRLPVSLLDQFRQQLGSPIVFPDIQAIPGMAASDFYQAHNIRTAVIVPMEQNEKLTGALNVVSIGQPRSFEPDEIQLLQSFSDQAAIAIGQARLFKATQQQARRLKILNELSQIALEKNDLVSTAQALAARISSSFHTDGCSITLWDKEMGSFTTLAAAGVLQEACLNAPGSLLAAQLQTAILDAGRAVFIPDVQSSPYRCPPASGKPPVRSVLGLPLNVGGQNLGGMLIAYDARATLTDSTLQEWEDTAVQVSLVLAKTIAFEEERRQRIEAEALHRSATLMEASLDMGRIFESLLESLAMVIPFDHSVILLNENGRYRTAASAGFQDRGEEFDIQAIIPRQIFEWIEKDHVPRISPDIHSDERWQGAADPHLCSIRSWIGIPIAVLGSPVGSLMLCHSKPNMFSASQARFAQTLANHAAVSISHVRLFNEVRAGRERLQTLARQLVEVQEAERRYLSHELHDEIGQILTGLQFTLEFGKSLPAQERHQALVEAQKTVGELMEHIREIAIRLRPSLLDDLGLLPALQEHFARYEAQTGIQIHLEERGLPERYPPEIETTVYRVVQEALTNIARYAGVGEAWIELCAEEGTLHLTVTDHGRGFHPGILEKPDQAFGITGMRERVSLVGGLFRIATGEGQGTRISAIFPLQGRFERRRHDRKSAVSR